MIFILNNGKEFNPDPQGVRIEGRLIKRVDGVDKSLLRGAKVIIRRNIGFHNVYALKHIVYESSVTGKWYLAPIENFLDGRHEQDHSRIVEWLVEACKSEAVDINGLKEFIEEFV